MVDTNRRRFLQGVGASGAVGIAGCAEINSEDADDTTTSDGTNDGTTSDAGQESGNGEIPADGVAVSLSLDRQKLQLKQQALSGKVQQGNLSQQEAQQEFQNFRTGLAEDAASAFEGEVDDVTIETRVLERGALVVTGPSDALLATLQLDSVQGLISTNSLRQSGGQ